MTNDEPNDLSERLASLSAAQRSWLEERLRAKDACRRLPGISPRVDQGVAPLSFAQQRLWFLEQLEPGLALYNLSVAVRLSGPLEATTLARSLTEIVRRHEVLRTTIPATVAEPVQQINPAAQLELPVEDLSGLPEAERLAAAQRIAGVAARRPFDLSKDVLLRALLLRLDEREHVFLIILASHCLGRLVAGRALPRIDGALCCHHGRSAFSLTAVAPAICRFLRLAAYLAARRGNLEKPLAFWKQQRLAGAPELLALPSDFPRPAIQSHCGARLALTVDKDLSQALRELSRREGVTLFMTLLAVFQTLLSRYSGQEDIVVGSPSAGRTRTEVEDLIGFFVNTLVLRTDLSGNPTFRELLGRVRETTLEAYAHQDVPFERLVGELQPLRTLGHAPLFQVMFALQHAPRPSLELNGVTVCPLAAGGQHREVRFDTALFDGICRGFAHGDSLSSIPTCSRRRHANGCFGISGPCWLLSRPTLTRGSRSCR